MEEVQDSQENIAETTWQRSKPVRFIASVDIALAIFSIFYNGRTFLMVLEAAHTIDSWPLLFIITFTLTFGIHTLQILLSMLLIKATSQDSTSVSQAFRIVKLWSLLTTIFLILISAEVYIGLVHFVLDTWSLEFLVFNILKLIWRLLAFYFVGRFAFELKSLGSSPNTVSAVVAIKDDFQEQIGTKEGFAEDSAPNRMKEIPPAIFQLPKINVTRFTEESNYDDTTTNSGGESVNEKELSVASAEPTVNVFLANSVCTVVQVTYGSPSPSEKDKSENKKAQEEEKDQPPESDISINEEGDNDDEAENNEEKV